MHDLAIRNGRIADGTGAPTFVGDIAVTDGVITEVGEVSGNATRVVDADGVHPHSLSESPLVYTSPARTFMLMT